MDRQGRKGKDASLGYLEGGSGTQGLTSVWSAGTMSSCVLKLTSQHPLDHMQKESLNGDA